MKLILPKRSTILVVAAMLLTSCAHLPSERPEPSLTLPESFSSAHGSRPLESDWWKSFGDAQLNALVEEALLENLDLRQAGARLRRARALAEQAGSERVPDISLEGSAARRRSLVRSPTGDTGAVTTSQFGLKLAASYEVDLWGRIGASSRAALRDFDASRYDLESAAMTLVAQVADLWYSIGALRRQTDLLEGQLDSSTDQLDLIELRFETGQASALDVYQQRGQLAALKSLRPQLESRLGTLRNQLAILLGRTPGPEVDLPGGELPELSAVPRLGLPAGLVRNRPDLRAAAARIRAADERVAVAVANRFPALRISADGGYSSSELSDIFDDWIWSLAGNIIAPLIDGGSRRAQVAARSATLAERIEQYSQAILGALGEVEDALLQESKQAELVDSRTRQLRIAESTLKQARSRYFKGLSDYLSVLQALQSQQELERGLIVERRQLVQYRIALHRALGGDYSTEAEQALRERK